MEPEEFKPAPPQISFSFQKKIVNTKYDIQIKETSKKQFIKGVSGDQIELENPEENKPKELVIARLENTLIIQSSKSQIQPPPADHPVAGEEEDKFVRAAPEVAQVKEYGLLLRKRNKNEQGTAQQLEERNLNDTLSNLPDVCKLEDYEEMPVEEFGKAILRGLGWKEGFGIGKGKKEVVPIQYLKRPERLGLGAQPLKLTKEKGSENSSKVPRLDEMVVAPSADGRIRNTRTLDEKLVHRSETLPGPRAGKLMKVVTGEHRGLVCRVMAVHPEDKATKKQNVRIRILPSEEEIVVDALELDERTAASTLTPKPAPDVAPAAAGNGAGSGVISLATQRQTPTGDGVPPLPLDTDLDLSDATEDARAKRSRSTEARHRPGASGSDSDGSLPGRKRERRVEDTRAEDPYRCGDSPRGDRRGRVEEHGKSGGTRVGAARDDGDGPAGGTNPESTRPSVSGSEFRRDMERRDRDSSRSKSKEQGRNVREREPYGKESNKEDGRRSDERFREQREVGRGGREKERDRRPSSPLIKATREREQSPSAVEEEFSFSRAAAEHRAREKAPERSGRKDDQERRDDILCRDEKRHWDREVPGPSPREGGRDSKPLRDEPRDRRPHSLRSIEDSRSGPLSGDRYGRPGPLPGREKPLSDAAAPSRRREDEPSRGTGEQDQETEDATPARKTWLMPHIKVKIIDKRIRNGKLYLKKGRVLDVHPGATADVCVDDTGDVLKLHENMLETVVPKTAGEPVIVVAGKLRGQRGRMLECRTTDGVAAIQLTSDLSIQRMLLDDLAFFTGVLDEDDEE